MKSMIMLSGLLFLTMLSCFVSNAKSRVTTVNGRSRNEQTVLQDTGRQTPVYTGVGHKAQCMLESVYPDVAQKFTRLFPDASGQFWIKEDRILYVYFLNNKSKMSAVFSLQGQMVYAIANLEISAVPGVVITQVQKAYRAYSLFNVKEIITGDTRVYEFVLENSKEYRVVQLTDTEIMETDKIKKISIL
jgi:hypothetical protein